MRRKANFRMVCEETSISKYCTLCDSTGEVREFKEQYICKECIDEAKKI